MLLKYRAIDEFLNLFTVEMIRIKQHTMTGLMKVSKNIFFIASAFLLLSVVTSCTNNTNNKSNSSSDSLSDTEQNIQVIDGSNLELNPYEYMVWLKSNKGLTYTFWENDSLLLSIMYQPYQLQAFIGMESTGMSYEQLLEAKKGFHYFYVECLYKKVSAVKKTDRSDYLNYVKNNIYLIKNNTDTLQNIAVEAFTSSIVNKPDNIMLLLPDDSTRADLTCVVSNKTLGLKDVKIKLPKKQFDLFPKLKI